MAIELTVPSVGESVTEVELGEWLKREGDPVRKDEAVAVIETDKATMELFAPVDGVLSKVLKTKGTKLSIGEVVGYLEPGAAPASTREVSPVAASAPGVAGSKSKSTGQPEPRVMPAAARLAAQTGVQAEAVAGTGPGGRVLKEDVQRASLQPPQPSSSAGPIEAPQAPAPKPLATTADREEEVVAMSLIRRKIAERLLQAQNSMALLTTFNEVDMSGVMTLRGQYQEKFVERYQIKLGFMSFFVKAVVEALKDTPALNAEVRGTDIVYRNYFDIGIAIGGGRGLVVPVLRNAERLSFSEIEQAIADFGKRVKENRIKPDDLAGGTFTITNGGVYGSLLSTPLINPPQSGVLGMHAIQDRPMAVNGQVVIRPMMYLALSYDHRIVDGREAVTFLRRIKDFVEHPARMLLEV